MGVNDFINIGNVIKKLRIKMGYSQKEMANKLGIAPSTYSGYETNYREPNKELIEKICKLLDVTPNQLMIFGAFEAEIVKRTEAKEKLKKIYNDTHNDNILNLIKVLDHKIEEANAVFQTFSKRSYTIDDAFTNELLEENAENINKIINNWSDSKIEEYRDKDFNVEVEKIKKPVFFYKDGVEYYGYPPEEENN